MITARLLLHRDDEKFVELQLEEAPILLTATHHMDGLAGDDPFVLDVDSVYRLVERTWPAITDPGTPATATYVFDHLA